MDDRIAQLAERYQPLAVEILQGAIRIPASYVDRRPEDGGDVLCGTSNHEKPRLDFLRQKILEIGAVDRPQDVGFDGFGNLWWTIADPDDGIPEEAKTLVIWDGHADTVAALRPRWKEVAGEGLDPYLGLADARRVQWEVLEEQLGYLPPEGERGHLVWGRGAADQLGGVMCQIVASKILCELRSLGALRGIIVRSYATVAEEDNEGSGPTYILRHAPPAGGVTCVPDVVILTEGTGCAREGALGIYRGQRGRLQIEVEVTGKSCHGSMPEQGRNPLEYGALIIAEAAELHASGEGFARDAFLGRGTRTASFATLETPSDCAVPERFTFRFDRRLTAGEDPAQALADIERMASVARARNAGLKVEVRAPLYNQKTWTGYNPGNRQIYPGWVTPEDHPAIEAAVATYSRVASPVIKRCGAPHLREEPRVGRWVFSTDGVGFCVPRADTTLEVPSSKRWVSTGLYRHPPMLGIGPGIEQNTHKIGECVDRRELAPAIAFLARFPSLYRELA
ncbi:MAG: peptidase dimerization domain-containing protein [Planctomycetota bacterium]